MRIKTDNDNSFYFIISPSFAHKNFVPAKHESLCGKFFPSKLLILHQLIYFTVVVCLGN